MCFSSTASFTAATVLGIAGVLTLRKAQNKSDYLLAAFPLIFASQQIVEGFNWLYLTGQLKGSPPVNLEYLFLLYADVIWPLLVPLAIFLVEPNPKRKKLMIPIVAGGIACSLYLFWAINVGTISIRIEEHHLLYRLRDVPFMIPHMPMIYLSVVCAGFAFTSYKWVRIFGIAILGAFIFTDYIAAKAYISVWCFFAAVLSSILYMHFRSQQKIIK